MNEINSPTLYLIPTALAAPERAWLLEADRVLIAKLRFFIVENAKAARAHLKALGITTPLRELSFLELNQHHGFNAPEFTEFLRAGGGVGLLSDAGCPAVADPGAVVVRLALQLKFNVRPLIGPSSIILGLMASGANGQRFAFKGYLPVRDEEKIPVLKEMTRRVIAEKESQIFIETPYRNERLIRFLAAALPPDLYLTVALNLTHPTAEKIISAPAGEWKARLEKLNVAKEPAVFILG